MEQLLRIERYLRRSGMARTRFGRLAANDPRLVPDMRNGRELRPPLRARVAALLDSLEGDQA